jgi:hypothetical protein
MRSTKSKKTCGNNIRNSIPKMIQARQHEQATHERDRFRIRRARAKAKEHKALCTGM